MSPVMNLQYAALVLFLVGVANVDELPIFEDKELMFVRQACQAFNRPLTEVIDNIYVSLKNNNMRAKSCRLLVVVTVKHR